MAVFGTGLAFSGLDRRLRTHGPQSIAPFPPTLQRRGEIESPDASGIFRPRWKIAAFHLRAPVLRPGCRPANGRDRGEIARHRVAHWAIHRNGFGAAVVR